jgi:hypothetical protein
MKEMIVAVRVLMGNPKRGQLKYLSVKVSLIV